MKLKFYNFLILLVVVTFLASFAMAKESTSVRNHNDVEFTFSLRHLKFVVFKSFGLNTEKIGDPLDDVSNAFIKRAAVMSETVEKAKSLQTEMTEREKQQNLQIYEEGFDRK